MAVCAGVGEGELFLELLLLLNRETDRERSTTCDCAMSPWGRTSSGQGKVSQMSGPNPNPPVPPPTVDKTWTKAGSLAFFLHWRDIVLAVALSNASLIQETIRRETKTFTEGPANMCV